MIYYETRNTLGMESLVHSFRFFLDRNKNLGKERIENYKMFLRFYRRMINLPPNDQKRVEKLKSEILEVGGKGGGRAWLLEKIEEMK